MSVKEKDAQVRDYYQNYRQWNKDADESYARSMAREQAVGASRGGANPQRLQALEEDYRAGKASMKEGEHYRQLKDAWTKGYKYNGEELASGAMSLARSRVESQLTEQGYKQGFREVAPKFDDGDPTTEEYWLKDGAKKQRVFDGESFSEDYRAEDYADFQGLIDKEYKVLAADDDSMFAWMEERYGAAPKTDAQAKAETEAAASKFARSSASGAVAGAGGGASAAIEGSWTMSGGVDEDKKQSPWI
jgi:hypothetical protein